MSEISLQVAKDLALELTKAEDEITALKAEIADILKYGDAQAAAIRHLREEIAALKAVIQLCFYDSCSPSGKMTKKTVIEVMKTADRKV